MNDILSSDESLDQDILSEGTISLAAVEQITQTLDLMGQATDEELLYEAAESLVDHLESLHKEIITIKYAPEEADLLQRTLTAVMNHRSMQLLTQSGRGVAIMDSIKLSLAVVIQILDNCLKEAQQEIKDSRTNLATLWEGVTEGDLTIVGVKEVVAERVAGEMG